MCVRILGDVHGGKWRAVVSRETISMILLLIASRLNLLCHVFPDPLIDTSLVYWALLSPPPPSLTDSSHASAWPLHAVIVSLFSSCRTGGVTIMWPYVTSGPTEDITLDQSAHPQSPNSLLWLTHNSPVTYQTD